VARGQLIPRSRWHFVDGAPAGTVALDGGFEPGRIYDVVYRTADPRVLGFSLSSARDLISFLKYDTSPDNPAPGLRYAIGWGVSQSGRYLRHFLYQGFNEDEQGRKVFDGMFDQVGGAGRGSFNHRFGQASRDALQYFNISSRSPTVPRPIRRAASPTACWHARSARTPRRKFFIC
jgi:hypothetical protein